MLRACICLAVLSLNLLSSASSLAADEGSAAVMEAARDRALEHAHTGRELYEKGQWQEAFERFAEAEQLHHAPTLLLYMARCKRKLDQSDAARLLYERILAEPLPPKAPPPFVEARREAERELAEVRTELAVKEAAKKPPHAAAPVQKRGSMLPGLVTLGLGATALGVGTITGALSLAKVSDVESRCRENQCNITDRAAIENAILLGNVSTAAFVVGGVATAAGAVLLVIRPGGEKSTGVSVGVGFGGVHAKVVF